MKEVMVKAWEIAKGAVIKFGGKVREYFAQALAMAWAEYKAPKVSGLSLCRNVRETEEASIVTEAHSGWSKGYLALVTLAAPGARFDLDRKFIRASINEVNRSGNGYLTYSLKNAADGIYEADSVARSYTSMRVYFRVQGGSVVEVFDDKASAKSAMSAAQKAA